MSSPRPNRFILNTDYMSLAQASKYSTNVIIPAGQTIGYANVVDVDVPLPTADGAIPRYLVTYQTTVWNMDTQQLETKDITVPMTGKFQIRVGQRGFPQHIISLSRLNNSTMRVTDAIGTFDPDEYYDSLTFKIDVSYIYPPNV